MILAGHRGLVASDISGVPRVSLPWTFFCQAAHRSVTVLIVCSVPVPVIFHRLTRKLITMATALGTHLRLAPSSALQCNVGSQRSGIQRVLAVARQAEQASFLSATGSGSVASTLDVPRLCTLQEFKELSEGGDLLASTSTARRSEPTSNSLKFYDLLVANARATVQVEDFETLSGRLAMLGLATALGNEFLTGHSLFSGIDVESLGKVLCCCALIAVSAAGLAVAKRGKAQVASLLTTGCKNVVDFAVDRVIEGLFFDDSDAVAAWKDDASSRSS